MRVNVVPGAFRHIRVWFTTSNVESVEPVSCQERRTSHGSDVREIPFIALYCSQEERLLIDFETARLAPSCEDACVAVTMYV